MPYSNPISGIYTITNRVNGKIYVGYSDNLRKRFKSHERGLSNTFHHNDHLQRAFLKYGKENFEFEVLEECPKSLLPSLEHYWVLLLRTNERSFGYNILPTNPSKLNSGHSEETKKKISIANSGRKRTIEVRERMSKFRKGRKQNKEWVEKRSISHRGSKRSKETCQKMSKNRPKKIILQYSLNEKFLKEWINMEEVVKTLKINASGIYRCASGTSKKSNGYIWKYKI